MKSTRHALVSVPLITGLALTAAPLAAQDDCDERMTVSRELSTDGIALVDIVAKQGSLEVRGQSGLSEVRVEATLCAERAEDLDQLDAQLQRSGSTARLEAIVPEWERSRSNRKVRVDLVVSIPEGMATRVVDGSGHTEIEGVGELDVEDGSGHLTVRGVAGDLTIEDGSGHLEIDDVRGSIEIRDGSGNTIVSGVGGSIEIRDGSGLIEVSDVTEDVYVAEKGSGQVRVDDVQGDLRVEGTRRERIHYRNVAGSLDLPRARRPR